MSPAWKAETCPVCEVLLVDELLMLVVCRRQPDGGIGIVSPPRVKVCSPPCLMRWLTKEMTL